MQIIRVFCIIKYVTKMQKYLFGDFGKEEKVSTLLNVVPTNQEEELSERMSLLVDIFEVIAIEGVGASCATNAMLGMTALILIGRPVINPIHLQNPVFRLLIFGPDNPTTEVGLNSYAGGIFLVASCARSTDMLVYGAGFGASLLTAVVLGTVVPDWGMTY